MSQSPKIPQVDSRNKVIVELAELIRQEVVRRCGTESNFEQRRDIAAEIASELLWLDEEQDLVSMVTIDEQIEIEGRCYKRLQQDSTATYYGRWGMHKIEEPLYREVGVHNGSTLKPLELRAGMVARHMTPDLGRIVGQLSAEASSREVERIMKAVGLIPPGRAFIEKRFKQMAGEISQQVEQLEQETRQGPVAECEIGAISCGLDRMSVRMSEPAEQQPERKPIRTEPYQRTAPEAKQYPYRKAWVGSTTIYDVQGRALETWRYGAEADADPNELARRVVADVSWVLSQQRVGVVHSIQDGAPELRVLPQLLVKTLPTEVKIRELVDFEHLMGYLDDVVNACEPEGDPHDWKGWYRGELMKDDAAIDRIWRKLIRLADTLPGRQTKQRKVVAAALSYIRKRKNKMRYATLAASHLPIGSGATESTCWHMQRRVQRPGQSWQVAGLRAVMSIRALVLSERWLSAWQPYAATHRKEVKRVA
jgi:hypothetical protein